MNHTIKMPKEDGFGILKDNTLADMKVFIEIDKSDFRAKHSDATLVKACEFCMRNVLNRVMKELRGAVIYGTSSNGDKDKEAKEVERLLRGLCNLEAKR